MKLSFIFKSCLQAVAAPIVILLLLFSSFAFASMNLESGINLPSGCFAIQNFPTTNHLNYYHSKKLDQIRLAFKWEKMQSVLNGPLNSTNIGIMDAVIQQAANRGMKIILDSHDMGKFNGVLISSNGPVDYAAFKDFWTKLAAHYHGNPTIIGYGLMNEPNVVNAITWSTAAQYAIDGIRTVDTTQTIYVAWWKGAYQEANTDPCNNLIYESHHYFDINNSGIYAGTYDSDGTYPTIGLVRIDPFLNWCIGHQVRGYIGEFGIPKTDSRYLVVMDLFMNYMKTNGFSGSYWAGGWSDTYKLCSDPINGVDSQQMSILTNYTSYTYDGNYSGELFNYTGSSVIGNLAPGKKAFSVKDDYATTNGSRWTAIDGSRVTSKGWGCLSLQTGHPAWLAVDLGQNRSVNKFVIQHQTWAITSNYQIQSSLDGLNWSDQVVVLKNPKSLTTNKITAVSARFFRVYVTNSGASDKTTRIMEFEIYGNAGTNQLPTVSLTTPTNASVFYTVTPPFSWTHGSDGSGIVHYDVNVDDITNRVGSILSCSNITINTGVHTWKVRAVDGVGNKGSWTAPRSFSVIYTNKPVAPNLVSPGNGASVGTVFPVFKWTKCSDAIGINYYDLNIDNITNNNIMSTNFTSAEFSTGLHSWKVRAVNNSGNSGLWSTQNTMVIVTNSPAVVNLISPANSTNLSLPKPIFNWTASTDSHGVDHYDLAVDGITNNVGAVTIYTSTILLSTGLHAWKVRVIDGIFNKGLWTAPRSFTLIYTNSPSAPDLSTPETGASLGSRTPQFVWTKSADASGIQSYDISIDAVTNNNILTTNTVSGMLSLGSHFWKVRAINNYGIKGLWSPSRSFTIIDTNIPLTVTLVSPAADIEIDKVPIIFVWTKSSDPVGILRYELSFDDVVYNMASVTNFNWTIAVYGSHIWKVRAVNTAGVSGPWSAQREFSVALGASDFIMSPNPVRISDAVPTYFYYDPAMYSAESIQFKVYSIHGELVAVLSDTAGTGTVKWVLQNDSEKKVVAGIYLVVMKYKGENVSKKPKKLGILK